MIVLWYQAYILYVGLQLQGALYRIDNTIHQSIC
jgi:hypothetical protein